MTAVDDFIANLRQYRASADSAPMVGDIDLFIAALQQLGTAVAPVPGIQTSSGRLTLTSGVPVLSSNVLAAGTLFFTPYIGNTIALYDGTQFNAVSFAEVSQALTDATKSPAATVANKNYDIFGWLDGTTFRATRGPAWTGANVRGAGAGTTELTTVNGIRLNAQNITNGPAAQRGTYLGTILTTPTNKLDMNFLTAAAGGGANFLSVWNMYNRCVVAAVNKDTTDTWNYTTDAWRIKNGNSNNRITYTVGIQEDAVIATAGQAGVSTTAGGSAIMISLDTETPAITDNSVQWSWVAANKFDSAFASGMYMQTAIGSHFICPCERAIVSGVMTWFGDGTSTGTFIWGISTFGISLPM